MVLQCCVIDTLLLRKGDIDGTDIDSRGPMISWERETILIWGWLQDYKVQDVGEVVGTDQEVGAGGKVQFLACQRGV